MGGYKSIKSVEIDFQPGLNIIIGKNGTGKTNFLDFLDNSLKMKFQGVRDFIFDASLCYKRKNVEIHIKGEKVNEINNFDNIPQIKSRIKAEIRLNEEKKEFSRLIMENSEDVYLSEVIEYFYKENAIITNFVKIDYAIPSKIELFHFAGSINLEQAKNSFYIKESILGIIIQFSENYLINEKYNISQMRNDFIIQLDIIHALPFFVYFRKYLANYTPIKDVRFNQGVFIIEKDKSLEFSNFIYEFKINDDWYFFDDLSDGSKRMIWIIYTFLEKKPKLILLEEPELGIHPHQLDLLMKFLKEQSQEKQIILTTHAPQCLDILTPEELNRIIICDIADKSTQLFHLSEQKMKKAQSYMEDSDTLSNYWRFSDLESR
jgi:predicted ATP-dependent endonuclease of OLD family